MEFQAIHEGIRRSSTSPMRSRRAHRPRRPGGPRGHRSFRVHASHQRELRLPTKCRVVELLWRVCLSDQEMDRYEEQLVRKIAELLHVEHKDFIAAKIRVAGVFPPATSTITTATSDGAVPRPPARAHS
ncbi:MAG: TerB family tellurite resistance protein [Arhodomonas sp.]|nr:TerB family tellurite resistance protein [Arhodomonas sp.]